MMKKKPGNPSNGLLKAIIEIFRSREPDYTLSSKYLTHELLERRYWGHNLPRTPERTVNMYCSQNTHILRRVDKDEYILEPAYHLGGK